MKVELGRLFFMDLPTSFDSMCSFNGPGCIKEEQNDVDVEFDELISVCYLGRTYGDIFKCEMIQLQLTLDKCFCSN